MNNQNIVSYVGAKGIIRNNKNEVLIVKENWSNGWGMPGGRIQESEINIPLQACLEREIKEELGAVDIRVGEYFDSMFRRLGRPKNPNVLFAFANFYICDYLGGEIKLQDSELLEFCWVSQENYQNYEYISGYREILDKYFKK